MFCQLTANRGFPSGSLKLPRRQRHQWGHSSFVPYKPESVCFHKSHFFPDTAESACIVRPCSKRSLYRQSRYGRPRFKDKGVWHGKEIPSGVTVELHFLLSPEVNTNSCYFMCNSLHRHKHQNTAMSSNILYLILNNFPWIIFLLIINIVHCDYRAEDSRQALMCLC